MTVELSQEATADFALAPARLVRVSGTVIDSTGKAVTSGFVRLVQRGDITGGFMGPQSAGRIRDDGTFTVTGVAPGTYTAVATAGDFMPGGEDAEVAQRSSHRRNREPRGPPGGDRQRRHDQRPDRRGGIRRRR